MTLRVEKMAKLLRESRLTLDTAERRVGWASRSHATDAFTRIIGVTPGRYRLYGPPSGTADGSAGSDAHLSAKDSQPSVL